jgi:carbonic anhydrase/acetyltransferase-like protein (isoleucine patch superfamily)
MIRESVVGDVPRIDNSAFVDPAAVIIGRVFIGPNCYIGPGVVIRADRFSESDDAAAITIGSGCCIQDLSVLHVHAGNSITVGDDTVINHGAVIHGTTTIGQGCFIGSKCIITHASLGDRVFSRLMSVIETVNIGSDRYIEHHMVINQQDVADRLRPITQKELEFMSRAVAENREYAVRYKYSLPK